MNQLDHVNLALLVARLFFGIGLAYHGYNKVFGGGGLTGTAGWFRSLGMKWPDLQARMAAGTELGAGLLFAAGLLTPFAAAGMIGVMVVAGWAEHRKHGFFVFKNGWEFTAAIGVVAWMVATIGPGRFSLDNVLGISWTGADGWAGALIAGLLGVGAAVAQLAVCYRPAETAKA
jgi:putative oxidoreductase